ncbi:hypothetical protein [Spirillospora sp. CA-294931]|uniref:hypothetical protein n=1 Tax=Spirillospora sp. CA-294931 TaxID=3240042 RepID=UPI003D931235
MFSMGVGRKGGGVRAASVVVAVGLVVMSGCSVDFGLRAEDAGAGRASAPSSEISASSGLESLSAEEVLKKAVATSSEATSLLVTGWVVKKSGAAAYVDLKFTQQGGMGIVRTGGKGELDFVRVGQTGYYRGNRQFWEGFMGTRVKIYEDRYLKLTGRENLMLAPVMEMVEIRSFISLITESLGPLTLGPPQELFGQSALTLKCADKKGEVHVSKEGAPRIMKVGNGWDDSVYLAYGAPVTVTLPPENKIFAPKIREVPAEELTRGGVSEVVPTGADPAHQG